MAGEVNKTTRVEQRPKVNASQTPRADAAKLKGAAARAAPNIKGEALRVAKGGVPDNFQSTAGPNKATTVGNKAEARQHRAQAKVTNDKAKGQRLKRRLGAQLQEDTKRNNGKKLIRNGTSFTERSRKTGTTLGTRKKAIDASGGPRKGKVETGNKKHTHNERRFKSNAAKAGSNRHFEIGGKNGKVPKPGASRMSRFVKGVSKIAGKALNRLGGVLSFVPTGPGSPIYQLLHGPSNEA